MSTHEEGVFARVHGGVSLDELAEIGIDLRETVDFSASINPYGPCPAVLHAARGRVVEARAGSDRGFAADIDAIESLALANDASVIYLASPNTPVGTRVPVERIAALAERLSKTTIVLDQAFVSLSDHPGDEKVAVPENVIRVRSLTKDHALAGLRLGYLLASTELAGRIEARRPPWMTSSIAEAAGIAAVRANLFVEETRALLRADRDELAAGLREIGLEPLPSTACFLTFGVRNSAVLRRRMLLKGILVRDCTSFGMPGFVRVAARPKADREKLLAALAEELPQC
jgi:histidinol-phosphate aminotransferase